MKLLFWNVRGFNQSLKQKKVVNRVRKRNVEVVCLLETRVKKNKMQEIISNKFPGWRFLHNYDYAYNRRIWLLWQD